MRRQEGSEVGTEESMCVGGRMQGGEGCEEGGRMAWHENVVGEEAQHDDQGHQEGDTGLEGGDSKGDEVMRRQ